MSLLDEHEAAAHLRCRGGGRGAARGRGQVCWGFLGVAAGQVQANKGCCSKHEVTIICRANVRSELPNNGTLASPTGTPTQPCLRTCSCCPAKSSPQPPGGPGAQGCRPAPMFLGR